ncbi:MAG: DUF503 domain-containing protein [Nitriliruptoraceae bacterium]
MGVRARDGKVHVGAARVDLRLQATHSLKDKRSILRRIAAAFDEMGCSVAEVGAQDQWQRAVLGIAVAASTPASVDRVLDRVVATVERDPRVTVIAVQELTDSIADGD